MRRLISSLKKLKQSYPCIWNTIEYINGMLVNLIYGRLLTRSIKSTLGAVDSTYSFRKLCANDASILLDFIHKQPNDFDLYFKPHAFDLRTFSRILKNGTYYFVGAFEDNELVGYCFIRCFINKSAFRGYIVDASYQGRGIAKCMGSIMTEVCYMAGFRSYATISRDNIASLQSQRKYSNVTILKELEDNYLYIEISKLDKNLVGGKITNLYFMLQEGLLYAAC